MDSFEQNILGVQDLIETPVNKVQNSEGETEGASSDYIDILELDKDDSELLALKKEWEGKSAPYMGKIESRQKINKSYLFGTQRQTAGATNKVVPSNLLFQSTATFVPQSLAKNPEPVVWSDNTEEGKLASSDIKTMLQYHADTLCLRKKLSVMVWHWSVYFTAVLKYGWNSEVNDISLEVRLPSNFIFDPDAYIDEYGDYRGEYLGERIQVSAEKLIELFPDSKDYITLDVSEKLGTLVTYTEWWTNDYCFSTYKDIVLDKHKNEFFNYEEGKENHFATPKMPYTFLSIFSLQEQPHDFTNLIEQNIANQDRVIDRDYQVDKNLAHGNNSIAVDPKYFTEETAKQAADGLENGDPILAPVDSIKRIPANQLPSGILEAQEIAKQALLGVYGTQGITAQPANEETTARGMILNQSFDSSRIGGGVGDALEQVADNAFNWFLQLYYVFYDEKHFASIMGAGRAVEYVGITMSNANRRFVVSVAPNSMKPKDELSQQNLAMERWKGGAIDPITLMKELDSPDPMEEAKRLVLWTTNPQVYLMTFFPDMAQNPDSANPPNPLDTNTSIPPQSPEGLSQEPANASLSQVQLPQ